MHCWKSFPCPSSGRAVIPNSKPLNRVMTKGLTHFLSLVMASPTTISGISPPHSRCRCRNMHSSPSRLYVWGQQEHVRCSLLQCSGHSWGHEGHAGCSKPHCSGTLLIRQNCWQNYCFMMEICLKNKYNKMCSGHMLIALSVAEFHLLQIHLIRSTEQLHFIYLYRKNNALKGMNSIYAGKKDEHGMFCLILPFRVQ